MNLDSKTMCNDVKLSSVCVCVCCAKLGCGGVLKVIILESLMGELLLHLVVGPKVVIDQDEATLLFRMIPNDQLWRGFLAVPV